MISIAQFIANVNELILNPLIILAFAISFVYFSYGIVKFLSLDATDKTRDESKRAILYGMIGMLIMFSVYGIIRVVLGTFGVSPEDSSLVNAKPYIIRN